jgi:hypothetical protein
VWWLEVTHPDLVKQWVHRWFPQHLGVLSSTEVPVDFLHKTIWSKHELTDMNKEWKRLHVAAQSDGDDEEAGEAQQQQRQRKGVLPDAFFVPLLHWKLDLPSMDVVVLQPDCLECSVT